MSDFRVTARRICSCGSTEVSTTVIVHVIVDDPIPELKAPAVPEIMCEICSTMTSQNILRK